ncbi:D-alanyl-D-alanine dipeptidase [Mycolicibacterium chitae]|uniref:D-alanyl-D-alanine dipeptidase n=2 Tax=Mycobacteriaceae TaxID=1762 RepID=A0A448IAW6_MYCCI|nr:D-alanyl-D-alanine dipeptidase [Mycolicibacterium chitae]VEG49570.1 peptidase M15D, vanX D-ala-D-ala dipeptidase [Mycolicibacterium chitae]
MRAFRRFARIRYALVMGAVLMATPTIAAAEPVGSAGQDRLVDVRTVLPDALIDLRYATADNFLGVRLYPPDARCLVHESLTAGLVESAKVLRAQGNRLVFWDCYRPHEVQVRMFEAVSDPAWVARPGNFARSHTAGRSVDVTLSDEAGALLDMGTDFDEFSPRAKAFATEGVGAEAQANRARLRTAMAAGGFTVYAGEWWHFDGPGAQVQRPILDVALS